MEVLSLHKIWSPNRKKYWVHKSQIHKCHTCGRLANLTNFVSPQICKFAELICGLPFSANLPPVLLIPVQVSHLCCTSGVPWLANIPKHNFLKKFEITLNLIFRGLEKEDSWKKPEAKTSCDTVPLKQNISLLSVINTWEERGREQLCRRMPRNFISASQFQRKSKSLVFFQSINFLWSAT